MLNIPSYTNVDLDLATIYEQKCNYELIRFGREHPDAISLDALFVSFYLSEDDIRAFESNIFDKIYFEFKKIEDKYSTHEFLYDSSSLPYEKKYDKFLNLSSSSILKVILDYDLLVFCTIPLLNYFASQQKLFLIELMSIEILNGLTYSTKITKEEAFDANIINNEIFLQQPLIISNEELTLFSENQKDFINQFLIFKTLDIFEGILRAKIYLKEKNNLDF